MSQIYEKNYSPMLFLIFLSVYTFTSPLPLVATSLGTFPAGKRSRTI